MARRRRLPARTPVPELDIRAVSGDSSLLDLVDNLLNHGVVLHGELVLGVAGVDLVYARLSLLLAAADRSHRSPRRRLRRSR